GFGRPSAGSGAPPVAGYGDTPPRGVGSGFGRPSAGSGVPPPGSTVIISGINRSVLAGQRIGLLGANGQGKSTLVKTIVGQLPLLAGEVTQGKGLSIGYFAQQELDVLSLDDGALMHMVRLARDVGPPGREQELRDFLGSFRFVGAMVTQPVGTLSGGEKARLVLAMLVWQRPNLLLLDEPTNHLDLTTREALSMALNEFEGTVMLVSHDRALLREVCDEFWLVTGGTVQPFDGDLDDYQRWLLDQARQASREQSRAGTAAAPSPVASTAAAVEGAGGNGNRRGDRKAQAQQRQQRTDQAKPLRKELTRVDQKLAQLNAQRTELETAMARASTPTAELAEQGKRLKRLTGEIDAVEAQWLELSAQVDALAA
ncbi:MAG: ATP-binding cassette domain-containing protein, partial [Burkholderiaceae bacterium]